MFKRDIYNQLQAWAERTGRKPLVLRGARQVGKTTLVNDFARGFDNYLHLNLEREEDARYAQIGGMPEVVADYAENGDLVRLQSIYILKQN